MVDVDRGDYRAVGVEGVDRVEPSAEPDFEHGDLDAPVYEQPDAGKRPIFEVRERNIPSGALHCGKPPR